MKRLINDGDIFDKYANLEEKSLKDHPEEKLGSFNWTGHRHISGTYYGAAYTTSLADGYMATDLRSAANPRGSILKEAKNYTDQKVAEIGGGGGGSQAKLYKHTVSVSSSSSGYIKITFYNYNDAAINSKTKLETAMQSIGEITATGFTKNGLSLYTVFSVFLDPGNKTVYANWYQIDNSGNLSMGRWILDNTFSYSDDVKEVR